MKSTKLLVLLLLGIVISCGVLGIWIWSEFTLSKNEIFQFYFPGIETRDLEVSYSKGGHFQDTVATIVFSSKSTFPLEDVFPDQCPHEDIGPFSEYFAGFEGFSNQMACRMKLKPEDGLWRFVVFFENKNHGPFYVHIVD